MENLYENTQYIMAKSLRAFSTLLTKIQSQVVERGESEQELLEGRLAPDMFPLVRQVQIMTDHAKGFAARVTGTSIPVFEDHEKSLEELLARIEKTLIFLESVSKEQFLKAEEVKVVLPYIENKFQSAKDYTRDFALPNFYFHLVIAYGILRMKGYTLGKMDFIGSLQLQDL